MIFYLSSSSTHTKRNRNVPFVYLEPSVVSDRSLFVQTSHLFVLNKRIIHLAAEM